MLGDVFFGIGKSYFFVYFIVIIGCYNGFNVCGGVDGVGCVMMNMVVWVFIVIFVFDFFFIKFFYILGV